MQLHSTPLQVSKRKKRNICMLIREMLQDYIVLTTFLLYLFNQGDFHESFLFFSKAKDRKLKFTGALERSMIQIMARPFYKTSGFGCSAVHCRFCLCKLASLVFGGRFLNASTMQGM